MRNDLDDAVFVGILERMFGQGAWVSRIGPNNAPKQFENQPEALKAGIKKDRLTAAMNRLIASGRVEEETYKANRHEHKRLRLKKDTII